MRLPHIAKVHVTFRNMEELEAQELLMDETSAYHILQRHFRKFGVTYVDSWLYRIKVTRVGEGKHYRDFWRALQPQTKLFNIDPNNAAQYLQYLQNILHLEVLVHIYGSISSNPLVTLVST